MNILRLQSPKPLHAELNPILLLVRITVCMCSSCYLFRQTAVLHKCGRGINCSFGLRLISKELHHSAIQTKIESHFGGFFHQITVHQPIGRKDSMQPVIRTSSWLQGEHPRARVNLHDPFQGGRSVSNFETSIWTRVPYYQFGLKNPTFNLPVYSKVIQIKGTVSRDFRLLVFFMNQFPPSI